MSTEHTFEDDGGDVTDMPPPILTVVDENPSKDDGEAPVERGKPPSKPKDKPKASASDDKETNGNGPANAAARMSRPLRDLQIGQDVALADYLKMLGCDEGEIRIDLYRVEPEVAMDSKTGKMVKVNGHLRNYSQLIDEAFISARHGGGQYRLRINRPNEKGKLVYFRARDVNIAGDPHTDDVPRNIPEPAAVVAAKNTDESPSMIREVFGVMKDQLTQAREDASRPREVARADPSNPALEQMIDMLRTTIQSRDVELSAMRSEMVTMRNQKPPEDPIKDKLLGSLIDGESGRITALRLQYESELNQLRQSTRDLEARIRDQADRDRTAATLTHDREISNLNRGHDITLAAIKGSFETQVKILEGQIRMLEKDNTEMRTEVRELRAKKDKGIIEQVKEMQTIKEALGVDDDDSDKGVADKIMDVISNPDTVKFAQGLFGKAVPATPAAAAQQKHKRQVVTTSDGTKFILEPNGQLKGPIRPKQVAAQSGGEDGMPSIDAGEVARVVGLLEKAYVNKQDAAIVAQTGKSLVGEEILVAIRDHGVDVFMAKVAKLPSSSPLSTLAGKNWLRAVGKALVGE